MVKIDGVMYIQIQVKTSNVNVNEIYVNIEQFDV